jgi:hypothetical protein
MTNRVRAVLALSGFGLLLAACSGGDGGPAAPTAAAITKLSGDEQAGLPGATLPQPLEVRVTDAGGGAVPGFTLTFAPSAGTVNPTTTETDSQGRARTTLTLPNQGANITVTVVGVGVPPVTFTARAVANTIQLTTTFLPAARRGLAYTRRVTATGGAGAAMTFAATGSLPPGITLAPDGTFSGTPTQVGAFPITIRVSEPGALDATAQITLNVCEPPTAMTVGEVRVSDPTARGACGLFLPAGAAGQRFRVGVVRTSSDTARSQATTTTVLVSGIGVTGTAEAVSPIALSSPIKGARSSAQIVQQLRAWEARRAGHLHDLRVNQEHAGRLGNRALLSSRPALAPFAASLPETIQLDPKTGTGCTAAAARVTANRLAEDDRMAIYQDATQNANSSTQVTAAQAQRLLNLYRDYGKPIIDSYFGGVPDTDSNGKIIVFITPAIAANVAGRFDVGDLFTRQDCASSNQGEYIYLHFELAREALNTNPLISGFGFYVLVHEVKHIASVYQRIRRPNPTLSPDWLEEGTAEGAAERMGRYAWSLMGGPSVSKTIVFDDWLLNEEDPDITQENAGLFYLMIATQGYLSRQPNSVTSIVDPQTSDIYASGWLFTRWLGDAYGGAGTAPRADSAFYRRLNDQATASGVAGVEAVTARTWAQLMEEYTAAAMVNGRGPINRAFTSYDFIQSIEIWCFAVDPVDYAESQCGGDQPGAPGAFPWPVTTDAQGVSETKSFADGDYSGPIGPSGMRVHDLVSNGTGSGTEVSVELTAPARVVVVRLR